MSLNALTIVFSTKLIPLFLAIIGFGLLITVHEFGHFLFCKLFKIHTPTFSIGMGPTIYKKRIGKTNFRIAAIPIGGYVEISGLAEIGQGKQKSAKEKDDFSFSSKPYWQKVLVMLGGVLFNLIFAYIVFSVLFFIGIPKKKAALIIKEKVATIVEEKYNFKSGDKIIEIEGKQLSENPKTLMPILYQKLISPISKNLDEKINLTILRDNKKVNLTINPLDSKKFNDNLLNSFELKTEELKGQYEKYPLISAIEHGIKVTNQWIYQIITGIKYLITQKSLKGAGGPIAIISKTFETAQKGFIPLFIFLAIISINLAIINLLPLGALDGGQILFATIEVIIRREIPGIIRLIINLASWALLLGLIVYLSYKDIIRLFFNH